MVSFYAVQLGNSAKFAVLCCLWIVLLRLGRWKGEAIEVAFAGSSRYCQTSRQGCLVGLSWGMFEQRFDTHTPCFIRRMELSFDAKSFHTHTPLWISYFKQRVFPQQKHSLPWTYQILKNPLHIHCSPLFIPSFAPFSSMPSGFWPCPVPQNVQHTAQGCSSEDDGGTKTPHLEVYLEKASNIHRWFFYVRRFSSIFSPYSSNSLLMQEAKRHAQMELSTLCLQWSWLCSTMAGGTEKRQTLRLTILIDSIWHAGILGFLMR